MKCICKFCKYEWESRTKKPKACPACKRYNYDKLDKLIKARATVKANPGSKLIKAEVKKWQHQEP